MKKLYQEEKNPYSCGLRNPVFSLSVKKNMNALGKNEIVPNAFEVLKFFFPHLRKVDRIYPDVIIGKEKTGGKKTYNWEINTDILIFRIIL